MNNQFFGGKKGYGPDEKVRILSCLSKSTILNRSLCSSPF